MTHCQRITNLATNYSTSIDRFGFIVGKTVCGNRTAAGRMHQYTDVRDGIAYGVGDPSVNGYLCVNHAANEREIQ